MNVNLSSWEKESSQELPLAWNKFCVGDVINRNLLLIQVFPVSIFLSLADTSGWHKTQSGMAAALIFLQDYIFGNLTQL